MVAIGATDVHPQPTTVPANKTAAACYSAVDRFWPACGLFDLTDGIYHGDPQTPYEQTQTNQHCYLLDQARCQPGRHFLDIGCGYGTLLAQIRQRGARAIGITVSPEQVRHCRRQDLEAYLLDYRAIPGQWDGTFDAVIANGPIEHFVQPADAAAARADGIYRQLFRRIHRLIDPNSTSRRLVTTTIHFVRKPKDPLALLRSPFAFPWKSDNFHWAVLAQGWGGYYPELGQVRRCAEGYFNLIEEMDGTEDYFLTSQEWRRRLRRALLHPPVMKSASRLLPILGRLPRQCLILLLSVLFSDSWNWQFRAPNPPTRWIGETGREAVVIGRRAIHGALPHREHQGPLTHAVRPVAHR